MGRPQRSLVHGEPHCYCVHTQTALGQALFANPAEAQAFLQLLEAIRHCFDARIYGVLLYPDSYYILLQHQERCVDSDRHLQQRWWQLAGHNKLVITDLLRQRFCSLPYFMQYLGQQYSKAYHQRHGGRGSIWAGRYRSCLLADDAALLAALAWFSSQQSQALLSAPFTDTDFLAVIGLDPEAGSGTGTGTTAFQQPVHIHASPLREVSSGVLVPTDEAPLGSVPAASDQWPQLLQRFLEALSDESQHSYGHALSHSWALGRAESLVPSLSRMARPSGRGRSRQLHDLNDDLGLCGIWG